MMATFVKIHRDPLLDSHTKVAKEITTMAVAISRASIESNTPGSQPRCTRHGRGTSEGRSTTNAAVGVLPFQGVSIEDDVPLWAGWGDGRYRP